VVGNETLFDDLARFVEESDGVLLVAQVDPDGDAWNGGIHGSSNLARGCSAASHCLLI
jgi:hypothetical protein